MIRNGQFQSQVRDRPLNDAMRSLASMMSSVVSVYLNSVHSKTSEISASAVQLASKLLNKSGVIAVPTDTIYGFACLAQRSEAVDRLYAIKHRDTIKPIAICVADVPDIRKWNVVTVSDELLNDLLPGPVTVVFEALPALNKALHVETTLLGTRIPNNEFMREVCRLCDAPIALTSANLSSERSCLTIDEFKHLWGKVDAVFDAGFLKSDCNRLGSTVVDLSKPGYYKIVRDGCAFQSVKDILENKYSLIQI